MAEYHNLLVLGNKLLGQTLTGYQKRGSVIHVPSSILLNVNLLTNLPMGPSTKAA